MQTSKVVVVGQGYVGLPVSMRAVEAGMTVVGVETDPARCSALESGRSFVEDVTDDQLVNALKSGRYLPTSDYLEVSGFDVAVITVPTPLMERSPDLSYVEAASRGLAPYVSQGCTVILESTTYPGTTDQLVKPILEDASGLTADRDFWLGYSPERIDPGNPIWNFRNTPKVVSGIGPPSTERVARFYSGLIDTVVPVDSTRVAEFTKLLENTFRHVNIALVNEMAIYARDLGVDVWQAVEAAATKPFGFMRFDPGPGVGGHCLPVDPSYLSWAVRTSLGANFRFIELANDINDHMPDYVVQRIQMQLNTAGLPVKDARIIVFGYAYKRDVGDVRESPAIRVVELLQSFGAEVTVVDPHVAPEKCRGLDLRPSASKEDIKRADLCAIITDHSAFDYDAIVESGVMLFDARRRIVRDANVEVL